MSLLLMAGEINFPANIFMKNKQSVKLDIFFEKAKINNNQSQNLKYSSSFSFSIQKKFNFLFSKILYRNISIKLLLKMTLMKLMKMSSLLLLEAVYKDQLMIYSHSCYCYSLIHKKPKRYL